jgi:Fibronectin type III domain
MQHPVVLDFAGPNEVQVGGAAMSANGPPRVEIVSLFRFLLVTLLVLLALTTLSSGAGLCAQVTLAWDPESAPDLAGYRVHYGTTSKSYSFVVDAGMQTTYTVTGLNEGTTYYFAATAYTTSGSESNFSAEITYTIPNGGSNITKNLVWRNTATGQNAVWYMNGATFTSGVMLPTLSDVNWKVVGAQ